VSPKFKPHPAQAVRVDAIGHDRAPVLVIDNFASAPEALIDMAEAAFTTKTRLRDGYPGQIATVPDAYAFSALEFLLPLLRKVFAVSGTIKRGGCDFQIMTTRPQDLTERQVIPHFDVPDVATIASVHFLCGPPFLGTAFYRHEATGFEVITAGRVAAYEAALQKDLKGRKPQGYINESNDLFTRVATYPAEFNRLIFFSAASLHSGLADPSQVFDPNPRRGRLTANMFLQFTA
jgi:hypothetical protein